MKKWFYPTAFCGWGMEEHAAIKRVIYSDQYTQGPEVAAFEKEFAAYHGRRYGVMCNSGSSANLLMISALRHAGRIKERDTAIVPAVAWSTTYAPIVQHGLDLMVIDVDETWNADPLSVKNYPAEVKLVVGCSILGNPAYLEQWRTFAGVVDAVFVEDNCESLGATVRDKLTGTFGELATFSFFWSHQIGAIEGGMVLTDDAELNFSMRMLRAHGWTRDVDNHKAGFKSEYDFRCFGYNVRALELHAAIAREQLRKLDAMNEQRRKNLETFAKMASYLDRPIYMQVPNGLQSPFGISFILPEGTRDRVAAALREAGIDCRLPTGGSFTKHAYGAYWRDQATPKADAIHENGMFLGNGPLDLTPQIERAVGVLIGVLG